MPPEQPSAAGPNKALTVAMFTNNYFPFVGGVPVSISRQAKGLRKSGHTVHIFAPKYPGQPPDADECTHRYRLITFYKSKVFHYAVVNIFSPKIKKDFKRYGFDVVHVHHPFWMGSKGAKLGRKYNIPVIFTYHTRFDCYYHFMPILKQTFKKFISHRIVKTFAKKCTAVFAPSQTSKDYLDGLLIQKPIYIMPTGIEIERFSGLSVQGLREELTPGGETLLCYASRLSQEKNLSFLIDCIARVKQKTDAAFKCILMGEGPEKDNVQAAIDAAGLAGDVALLGKIPQNEIGGYFNVSDIFVYASKTETQGMVLTEAMAGGCPVVAVSSGGVDDVVEHGYNGFKSAEDAGEWSDYCVRLIEDKELRNRMSANAVESAKKFSLERITDMAAGVYAESVRKIHTEGKVNG